MTRGGNEQLKLAALGWLATVATSLAFLTALSQQRCIAFGAALSAIVVLVGVGLRLLRSRAIVVLLVQLVAAAELMLVTFGHHLKYHVVPTPATFSALRDSLAAGLEVANKYAAPAPASVGLLIMVVFLIGVVAALVDFFAVGLRKAPLAGLPLLALYTVPVAALPDGVPFYGFVPGALSYIALLMADERHRLAHWGRLVGRTTAPDAAAGVMDTSGLVASGRRISTLALLAAVFVPFVVPVLSTTIWGRSVGLGGNGNGSQLTFSDPMVSLASSLRRPNPVDLITVSSDITPQYLRLAVLDKPGPDAWTTSPLDLSTTLGLDRIEPRPPGMDNSVSTSPHSMSIELHEAFPADSAWLPVPFLLRNTDVGPNWGYVPADQTIAAKVELAIRSVSPYNVAYSTMSPTAQQLRSAGPPPPDIVSRYGTVPSDLPAVVAATARKVTAGATSDYERAVDLQSFFRDRSEFTYDVTAGYGYGYQAMAQFLQQRRGFCQHFAATMAMMARTLGIPSRVVVGFLQPQRNTSDSTYVFTSKNVHSWPELYFQGVGWVRFEPTQGVGAPYPQWAGSHSAPKTHSTVPVPTKQIPGEQSVAPRPTSVTTNVASGQSGSGGGFSGQLPSKGWLIPLGALAVLCLPASLRFGVRRSRLTRPPDGAAAAEAAWLELRDFLRDLRLPWSGSMTPRARQRSIAPLVAGDDEAASALQRLVQCVERARYAATLSADVAPADDASTVMQAISRRADNRQRLRALLWPTSLLPDLQAGWSRIADRLGGGSPTGH